MECYVYLYCVYVYRCVDSTLFVDSFWLFLPYFESLPILFSLGEAFTGKESARRGCFDGKGRNGRIRFAVVFNDGCRNEKIAEHIPSVDFFCLLARNYLKTNKDTLSWYKFCFCPFEFATFLSDLSVCAYKSRKS